jgi:hypothetical protein
VRWAIAMLAVAAVPAPAAPPTARQAAEDEALVRRLVEARLAPLLAEWRERAGDDVNLAGRLDLALLEIELADASPAERLAAILPARAALLTEAEDARDPRRAAWALDLATDRLVATPALDGRVATLAAGIADPGSIERWREELDAAEATLALAAEAIAATPRGPLALPEARAFRRGWEERAARLGALAAGTRALLEGRIPDAMPDEVPPEAVWNDLALLSAISGGPERLRSLAADSTRGPLITLAAACALDLAAGDGAAQARLAERAAALARDRSPAIALLSADAAVRAGRPDDPGRFAAWEALLDATPAARRGTLRGLVLPRLQALPPSGGPAAMGDFELALRSLAEPMPEDLAAAVAVRPSPSDAALREANRLLEFARLRGLAARGELAAAASIAERLATRLDDDPIAAAGAETLVRARTALAAASTDEETARAEREALELATGRFPRSPAADRWSIDLALARLASGETGTALDAIRRVPDASRLGPEARAVEALVLARSGDTASADRAAAILGAIATSEAPVAARVALARALLSARAGDLTDAPAAALAIADDPTVPFPLRSDALRVALELGASPAPSAAREILAGHPRARSSLLAALRTASDPDRTRALLAALADALAALTPDERLVVATATLGIGAADTAARMASETMGEAPRGGRVALAAALLRADALRSLGGEANLAEAFTFAGQVASDTARGSPSWWEANALQLEILEASGRNRDQIVPWINRLRALDGDLGGTVTQDRIEAVARRTRR